MTYQDKPSIPYQPSLDGLRAIAIGLVLFDHWAPWKGVHDFLEFGRLGLLLFFILSGYLITSILLKLRSQITEGKIVRVRAFKAFYMRRVLRIAPLYLLVIGIAVFVFNGVRKDAFFHLLFLQNLSAITYPDNMQPVYSSAMHLWSLAVEEQFYIVWAPIVLLVKNARNLIYVCIAAIILALVFKAYSTFGGLSMWGMRLNTLGNIDSLAIGSLLAINTNFNQCKPQKTDWVLAYATRVGIVFSFGLLFLSIWHTMSLGYVDARKVELYRLLFDSGMQIVLVTLFACGLGGVFGFGFLAQPWLIWVGKRSYGIYVWHEFIRFALTKISLFGYTLPSKYSVVSFVVFLVVVLVVSELSWRFIESPFLRQKNRYNV